MILMLLMLVAEQVLQSFLCGNWHFNLDQL